MQTFRLTFALVAAATLTSASPFPPTRIDHQVSAIRRQVVEHTSSSNPGLSDPSSPGSSGSSYEASAEAANNAQVSCQAYQSLKGANPRDSSTGLTMEAMSVAPCKSFCAGLNTTACYSGGFGNPPPPPIPPQTDSSGNVFVPGVCRCNIPLLDDITTFIVDALPLLGEITCAVMFQAFDDVLQLASFFIPGEGEVEGAAASTQWAVKAAKYASTKGQDADDAAQQFISTWSSTCGAPQNYTDSIQNLYPPLIGKGKPGGGLIKPKDPKTPTKPSDPIKASDAPKESVKPSSKPSETDKKPTTTAAPATTTKPAQTSSTSKSKSKDSSSSSSSTSSNSTMTSTTMLTTTGASLGSLTTTTTSLATTTGGANAFLELVSVLGHLGASATSTTAATTGYPVQGPNAAGAGNHHR